MRLTDRFARHLTVQHAVSGAVAAGTLAIALAEGGYGPVAFAAGAVIAWAAVLIGLAVGVLPRAEPPAVAVAAGACLALLAALTAISISWASDNGRAFEDAVRTLGYLGLFALAVVATRRGDAGAWLRGLAIGLVAVAVVSLGNRFEPSFDPSPFADTDLELGAALPAAQGRLSYPIGYWNGLASAMAVAVVLLGWIGAHGATRIGRAIGTAALPLPALAIYASTSEGGAIAVAIGVGTLLACGPARARVAGGIAIGGAAGAALIVLAARRDELLDRPGTELAASQGDEMLIFTLAAVAVAGLARWLVDKPLQHLEAPAWTTRAVAVGVAVVAIVAIVAADPAERFDEFKQEPTAEESAGSAERQFFARAGSSGRYQFWAAALDAFESEPLRGLGAGGYEAWWNQNGEIAAPARNAHSLFFETLSELGLAGAALAVAFLALSFVAGARRLRAGPPGGAVGAALAVMAAGTVGALGDWTWDLPAAFGIVVVAAALLTGPATLPAGAGREGPGPLLSTARSRRRFAGGVAVLLVAWISICAAGLLLLSRSSVESSRDAASRGDLEAAAEAANDAIDLQPWAAEPRDQLAFALAAAGDIDAARATEREAIERAPEDWRYRMRAACFELSADDDVAARELALRARALNPRAPELAAAPRDIFATFC